MQGGNLWCRSKCCNVLQSCLVSSSIESLLAFNWGVVLMRELAAASVEQLLAFN